MTAGGGGREREEGGMGGGRRREEEEGGDWQEGMGRGRLVGEGGKRQVFIYQYRVGGWECGSVGVRVEGRRW